MKNKYTFTHAILFLCLYLLFGKTACFATTHLDPDKGFAPPLGKTLLIIGQDQPTIDHYVKATGVKPAGVMVYTSIQQLSGLTMAFNNGAGIHYADYLMKKYPHSILQLGLYMVGALKKINQGFYDGRIKRLADYLSGRHRPVFLRIGYEFDDPTNHYDPAEYILAFRRIVDLFRQYNVKNVAFIWHSGAHLVDKDLLSWYPGDDYVDWVATSFFSTNQYQRIKEIYAIAQKKNKPFMFAEASPFGIFTLRGKEDWYQKFFSFIEEINVQAACYINSDWDKLPAYKNSHFGDARIEAYAPIKKMWMHEIKKSRYLHARDL